MSTLNLSTFPHEILEKIFSFCDAATLAAVGRVNLASLELSSSFLYEDVDLKDTQALELFLCASPSISSPPSPSRIASFLSLLQVRVSCIISRTKDVYSGRLPQNEPLKLDQLRFNVLESPYTRRLPAGGSALRLLFFSTNPSSIIFVRGPVRDSDLYPHDQPWIRASLDLSSLPWNRLETVVLVDTTLQTNTCTENHNVALDRKSLSRARLIYDWQHPASDLDSSLVRGLVNYSWQLWRWVESDSSKECRVELWVESEERVQEMKDVLVGVCSELGKDHGALCQFLEVVAKPGGHEGYWEDEQSRRKRERRIR